MYGNRSIKAPRRHKERMPVLREDEVVLHNDSTGGWRNVPCSLEAEVSSMDNNQPTYISVRTIKTDSVCFVPVCTKECDFLPLPLLLQSES